MNVNKSTDPVFSLIFVDGYWISRWMVDGWMDGWRGTDGLDVDGRINRFIDWRWRDGNDKMHVDGWIKRFMQIGFGWMGMIKWM